MGIVDREEGERPPVHRPEGRARVGQRLADEERNEGREDPHSQPSDWWSPVLADPREARADADVRATVEYRLHDQGELARIVLAVAVDLNDEVAAELPGRLVAGLHGTSDPEVAREAQHARAGLGGDHRGLVEGRVVDDDDLHSGSTARISAITRAIVSASLKAGTTAARRRAESLGSRGTGATAGSGSETGEEAAMDRG